MLHFKCKVLLINLSVNNNLLSLKLGDYSNLLPTEKSPGTGMTDFRLSILKKYIKKIFSTKSKPQKYRLEWSFEVVFHIEFKRGGYEFARNLPFSGPLL